ncbi:MAG: sulfotransferase [Verrucomicrobiota bacterium]
MTPAASAEAAEYGELFRARLEHLVEVREPLVLISQIHRSGGTLLSQLFDGHPECHAHPHELAIGYPKSRHWPQLDLARPGSWFDLLDERYPEKHFRAGYKKPAQRPGDAEADVFPFLFPPRLQRAIFERCVAERQPRTERDVLDAYFTSYFNAWLDNENLYPTPKKVVTAFAPRVNMKPANVERFFAAYPDGWLVSMVREPRAWYASARTQKDSHAEVGEALRRWVLSAETTLGAEERHGDRVVVLTYEQLVRDTPGTMEKLAARLGLTVSPVLLEPTFNGRAIRANSSAPVSSYGVLSDRTTAYRESLDEETIARVDELAGDLYERAVARSL